MDLIAHTRFLPLFFFLLLGILTIDPIGCSRCNPSIQEEDNKTHLATSRQSLAQNVFIEHGPYGKCANMGEIYRTKECITHLYGCVNVASTGKVQHVLVTGGAGFVGSHLVDSLMLDGYHVTVVDNFSTGRQSNIAHWLGHDNFTLVEEDIASLSSISGGPYDQIYHLAAPASPLHYMADPIKTINTIVLGSMNVFRLAEKSNVTRIVLASTSEIYGDPLVHPQVENYWGNTNPVGPRSCYDESKRLCESLAMAYTKQHKSSIAMARIFNTYGPRMHPKDGRVISNFVSQAIQNKSITIYGDGSQTRSFQYVSDLILGLRALMGSNLRGPVNLGNPQEIAISTLATKVKQAIPESSSNVANGQLLVDDPSRRRPDINKAIEALSWKPSINLMDGLKRTIEYFKQELRC